MCLEQNTGHIKEKVTRTVSVDLLRGKSHLTILLAFYDTMTRSVDVRRCCPTSAPKTICHNILVSKLGVYGLDGWAARWVKNWLGNKTQRIVVMGHMHGSVLGVFLFNTFINSPVEATTHLLMKFADGNIVEEAADTLYVRAAIQQHPDRLEGWAERNLTKFNKDK